MPADSATMSSASAAQDGRIAELMRAFQRQLRCRPTEIERSAMRRAALLTARAELAAQDASVSIDDLVRLDNAAQRARTRLADLIGGFKRRPPPLPTSNGLSASDHIARLLAEREGA